MEKEGKDLEDIGEKGAKSWECTNEKGRIKGMGEKQSKAWGFLPYCARNKEMAPCHSLSKG